MKFLSMLAMGLCSTVVAASKKVKYERLDKSKAALLIVDLQVGLYGVARDFDPNLYRDQMIAHAAIGKAFDIPVVLTTSAEVGPNGPLPKEILEMYSNQTVIQRQGEVNAWDSKAFRDAVIATGRTQFIIAGIATDVCTTFLALSLRDQGFEVYANVEASGTTTALVRDVSNDRMAQAGVQNLSFFAIVCELMRDWRSKPGAQELIPFFDKYYPAWAYVARAHAHAIKGGVLQPGQEEII
ncbi:putative hydrolase YcaC [Paramyrothecium foliicola]|nr:putative hydrolase YcaC [Paramyrothecium foliicola]